MREQISEPRKFVEPWQSSFIDPKSHPELAQKMIPCELLNNLAVLLIEDEQFEAAAEILKEAAQNCETLL
jgi:hypothetical protein